jgi:hypothetical protein
MNELLSHLTNDPISLTIQSRNMMEYVDKSIGEFSGRSLSLIMRLNLTELDRQLHRIIL